MRIAIIGLFVVLLIGSLVFAYERILFSDASFILFRIINIGTLQIQEQRYGSFITQMFPLAGTWLHLPLNWLVILYSVSFNLFFLAVAALLIFKFRNYSLAILMSFYFLLFVSDTWFWTNNEVHQGIAWMFLFFATIFYLSKTKTPQWISFLLFLLLAFLSIYTHPLVLFPATFLWIFFLLQRRYRPFNVSWSIIYSAVLIIICVSRFLISASGEHYDSGKLYVITHHPWKSALQIFSSPLTKEILKRTLWNYWLVPILFITGFYYGVKEKKYLPLLLTAAFCIIYFVAVCITFDRFFPLYIESELMPLSIIAATPFVCYTFPKLKLKSATIVLVLVFTVRLIYIGASAEKFLNRKKWLDGTLQAMREQKITKGIIYEDSTLRNKLFMDWSAPAESLIASSLHGDHPNLTFIIARPDKIKERMPTDPHLMITTFDSWSDASLNKHYFQLDTASTYQLISITPK